MRKIPTLFERDWTGNRSRVLDRVNPGCEWVLAGEGIATRKLDGTCCMIREGKLYKRRELKHLEPAPAFFEEVERDTETGKTIGWLPVGEGPEDRWHREAFSSSLLDGTYELIGPKIQGNPEFCPRHELIPHGTLVITSVVRTYEGLCEWFSNCDVEGIVFYHPDGRMAKIKCRDFGFKRIPPL